MPRVGCRAAAAAQITARLSHRSHVDDRFQRPVRGHRAPVKSVHTSLHMVERHTSSLLSLLSIQPFLVGERHLRHYKAL